MTHVCISPKTKTPRVGLRLSLVAAALGLAFAGTVSAQTGPNPNTLARLMQAKPSQELVRLSPVREAALEASARALGTQTGLIEHAQEIAAQVATRRVEMEKTFRFGDLVIGQGVLPPVLLHTENAATVTDDTMRLAGAVYEIKHPARFFTGAPSWRDWLLMGLPTQASMPEMPANEQLLPRDDKERAFWQQKVKEAYISGREQAREIFDHNLSTLEQVYGGMRTFYDLYQRNMVSAPIIAKSQEIVTQDDPNTIVVGDTLFRITMPAQFQTNPEAWRALQAKPSTKPLLPIGHGFDPEQVRYAYAVYQEQLSERHAQAVEKAQANSLFGKKPERNAKPKSQVKPLPPTPAQAHPVQTGPAPQMQYIRIGPTTPALSQGDAPPAPASAPAPSTRAPAAPPTASLPPASAPASDVQVSVEQGVRISTSMPLFSVPSR